MNIKQTVLIVCEGKNTEPSYFEQFRVSTVTIKTVGVGEGTTRLVEQAKKIANNKTYEQVWVVFDKDHHSDSDFNQAIEVANSYKFGVAYSNQSFEYWILLHLIDHQGERLHRGEYENKINSQLKPYGIIYNNDGKKLIKEDLFDLMSAVDNKTKQRRVNMAITRARRNHKSFSNDNITPAKSESSTTVYELVEVMLKYI